MEPGMRLSVPCPTPKAAERDKLQAEAAVCVQQGDRHPPCCAAASSEASAAAPPPAGLPGWAGTPLPRTGSAVHTEQTHKTEGREPRSKGTELSRAPSKTNVSQQRRGAGSGWRVYPGVQGGTSNLRIAVPTLRSLPEYPSVILASSLKSNPGSSSSSLRMTLRIFSRLLASGSSTISLPGTATGEAQLSKTQQSDNSTH